jgi:hypothetical protein
MASLKLVLTDAAGDGLVDHLTVDLFALQGSARFQVNSNVNGSLLISGIDVSTGPVYRVSISPANHRVIQAFVSLSEGTITTFAAAVPVDPGQVQSITGPDFAKLDVQAAAILNQAQVPLFNDGSGGLLQGAPLYTALDRFPLLKACFLNITAKSAATLLPDGTPVLDQMLGAVRIEQDRLFIKVTPGLVEETSKSNAFHAVNSALHDPLPGYKIVSSFKTFDRYGNLQLTFQRQGDTGVDYAVDVDIDDAQGIEHIFQVLRNSVNGPTNPYDIHDILLQQNPRVDPGYTFNFAAKAASAAG